MSITTHAHLSLLTRLPVLPNFLSESNILKKHNTNGQQDLQFVYLPNNLRLDIATRRRVRSHVARDFRRRAKVSGSSSLGVDLATAKCVTRDGAPGQQHRFKFGRQGLQETGKRSERKLTNQKVSSVSQNSILSKSPVIDSANAAEDPGGIDIPSFPSLQSPIATEGFTPSLSADTSYSSKPMWDKSNPASSQSNTTGQCCTTPRRGRDRLESSQLVCGAKSGHGDTRIQKLYLARTGTGNLDPFNTIPIADSSCRTQALIHHCKHFISLTPDTPLVISNDLRQ